MTSDAPSTTTPTTTRFTIHPARILLVSSGLSLVLLALASELLPDSTRGLGVYQVSGLIIGAGLLIAALIIRKLPLLIAAVIGVVAAASPPVVDRFYDPPISLYEREFDAFVNMVPDERLVRVIPPNYGGHDANGFRNDSVPDHADIVTIGDSQTWGFNAERDENWPNVLGDLVDQSVYNMGVGGYGPVHYWVLASDALAQFDPDTIIIGFYFGNDLHDAYTLAYRHEPYFRYRDPALADTLADNVIERESAHSYENLKRIWFNSETNPTAFVPEYRLFGVNIENPRIAEGLRISQVVLGDIADMVDAADKRLVVLIIPTKEFAYRELVQEPYDPLYARLIDVESEARTVIIDYLAERGIEYVDSLPALSEHLAQGEALYLKTPDGHPAPAGYRVIAETLAAYLGANPAP